MTVPRIFSGTGTGTFSGTKFFLYRYRYHPIPILYYTIFNQAIPNHIQPNHTIPYSTKPYQTIFNQTIPYHVQPNHTIPYSTKMSQTIPGMLSHANYHIHQPTLTEKWQNALTLAIPKHVLYTQPDTKSSEIQQHQTILKYQPLLSRKVQEDGWPIAMASCVPQQ